MKVRAIVVLTTILCFSYCFTAGAFGLDGDWSDWFSYAPAGNYAGGTTGANDSSSNAANTWVNPDVLASGVHYFSGDMRATTSDGGSAYYATADSLAYEVGGYTAQQIQSYDIEAIVSALEVFGGGTGRLWFGMVSGYDENVLPYNAGDLFVDLNGDAAYDYAVGTSTEDGRAGDVYMATFVTTATQYFGYANPYRVADGESTVARGAGVAWGGGNGDAVGGDGHNFLELYLDLTVGEVAYILDNPGSVSFHWTMQCGNDWVTNGSSDPYDPEIPVPEPATVALLLLGLVGFAARKRFVA